METITSPSRTRRVDRLRRAPGGAGSRGLRRFATVAAVCGLLVAGFTAPAGATAPGAPGVTTATTDPAAGGLYDLTAPDGYEFLPRLEDAILREINTYRTGLGLNALAPMHDQGREIARLNSMWSGRLVHSNSRTFTITPGRAGKVKELAGCDGRFYEIVTTGATVQPEVGWPLTNQSLQSDIDRAAKSAVDSWSGSPLHDEVMRAPEWVDPVVGAVVQTDPQDGGFVVVVSAGSMNCADPELDRAPVAPTLFVNPEFDGYRSFASSIDISGGLDYVRRPIRAVFTPTPGSGGQPHDLVLNPDESNRFDVTALPRQAGRWRFTRDGGVEIPAGSYEGVVALGTESQRFEDLVRVPTDIVSPTIEREMNVESVEVVWRVDPTVTRTFDGQTHVAADWSTSVTRTNTGGRGSIETITTYIDSGGSSGYDGAPVDRVRWADGQKWVPAQPPACTTRPDNTQYLCRVVYDTGSWQAPGWVRDGCDQTTWIRNGNSCTPTTPTPTPTPAPTGAPGPWVEGGCSEIQWHAWNGSCVPPPITPAPPLPHPCDNGGCDNTNLTGNTTLPGGASWAGPGRRKGRSWLRAVNLPATTTGVTARNGRTIGRLKFTRGHWMLRVKTRGMWKVTITTPGGNHTLRWRITR